MSEDTIQQYWSGNLQRDRLSPTAQEEYDRIYAKDPELSVKPMVLKEDDFILGFDSGTFSIEHVRTLDMHLHTGGGEAAIFSAAILGSAGSGKSVLLGRLAEYVAFKRRTLKDRSVGLLFYDPKREFHRHRKEAPFPDSDPLYRRLGLRRRGMDIVTVSPAMLGVESDVKFKVSYEDIAEIAEHDPDEALRLLTELLSIEPQKTTQIDIIRACMRTKFSTWHEFTGSVEKEIARASGNEGIGKAGGIVLRKLDYAKRAKVIGDRRDERLDIFTLLLTHDCVDYWGKIRTADIGSYVDLPFNATLKIALARIFYDCQSWNQYHSPASTGKLDEFWFFVDEADQIVSIEDTSTNVFVRNMLTRGRTFGINVCVATQDAGRMDRTFLAQVKHYFCSWPSPENVKAIEALEVLKESVDIIKGLKRRVVTSAGTEQAEFVEIGPDRHAIIFVSMLSETDFMRRMR